MGLFKDFKNRSEKHLPTPRAKEVSQAMGVLTDSDDRAITGTPIAASGRVLDNPVPEPEAGVARMSIPLEVSIPGQPAYLVHHVFNASRMRTALLPGTEIPLRVDGDDPNRVAIAWEQVGPGAPARTPAAPAQMAPTSQAKLERLSKLGELRERGILSQDEFDNQKARILAS